MANKQTPLIFTEPCMNNGRVKLSTVLKAARPAPVVARRMSKKTKVTKNGSRNDNAKGELR